MEASQRAALFWLVCIPTRLTLAELARRNVQAVRIFAAIVSYRWLNGLEDHPVGAFGGPAWWADLRPVHGAFWGAYAVTNDARFLFADTAFGAYSAAKRIKKKSSSGWSSP